MLGGLNCDGGVHVSVDIKNEGIERARAGFVWVVYLSTDEILSDNDTLLGWIKNEVALESGEMWSSDFYRFTFPPSVDPGFYHVGVFPGINDSTPGAAVIMREGFSKETVAVRRYSGPDLISTEISFTPDSVEQGQEVFVSECTKNVGTVQTGSFYVGIYLSDDPVIDTAEDQLIGFRIVSNLLPNQSSANGGNILISSMINPGIYYVGTFCDYLDQVGEGNEYNNWLVAPGTLTVTSPPPPLADLTIASLSFTPATVHNGDLLSIDYIVENEGTVGASNFHSSFYLSEDQIFNPLYDIYLGEELIGYVAPGGTYQNIVDCAIPSTTPNGRDYYVVAFADVYDIVVESDENNNYMLTTQTLRVDPLPAPDLIVQTFGYGPKQLVSGESINWSVEIKNIGIQDVTSTFTTGIYLSNDSIVDPAQGDIQIGSYDINSLSHRIAVYGHRRSTKRDNWKRFRCLKQSRTSTFIWRQ